MTGFPIAIPPSSLVTKPWAMAKLNEWNRVGINPVQMIMFETVTHMLLTSQILIHFVFQGSDGFGIVQGKISRVVVE